MKDNRVPVQIMIPCITDQFSPNTGFNMVKLLERAGCKVSYNIEQTCCGQPAYHAGYFDFAKEVGEKFIDEFKAGNYVVSLSSSCTAMVKSDFNALFENTAIHNTCKSLQKNFYEFSDFIVNVLDNPNLGSKLGAKATLLDSCRGLRSCGIHSTPRQMLKQIEGLELIEMHKSEECCGFGGVFSTKFENLSVAMAKEKLEMALDTGAEFLVFTDPGCMMHLESYISKNNLPIRPIHLVDLIVKGIRD
jgi:L-lactate dehydrogenase complex protein LldE